MDQVEVTQADRDAAEAIYTGLMAQFGSNGVMAVKLTETTSDADDMVQAFARHRITTLTAAPASPVPGWRMVPEAPTEEMVEAWETAGLDIPLPITGLSDAEVNRLAATADWSAMLNAAPAAPSEDKPHG